VLKHADKTLNSIFPEHYILEGDDQEAGRITLSILSLPDHEISENFEFKYHVIYPSLESTKKAIILLHGFNERNFAKYLPWASLLASKTKAAVILFPIAFHMNRSPEKWVDAHLMRKVSNLRKKLYPNVIHSTLSNAAISVRISANPARFFWSGLQTFYDVITLTKLITQGKLDGIEKDSTVDFFTYSIGSFLGEILMMTNEGGIFDNSRLVTFCGGPVFNRLSPVSKFILDSEASVELYSFMVEHLQSHIKKDQNLGSYLSGDASMVGKNYRAMLNYRLEQGFREETLKGISKRVYAVALKGDEVVPHYEVINTLQGTERNIFIKVDVVEPPYPFRHEDPFPITTKDASLLDRTFREIFEPISEFLS
jgi:hypothetical protein